MAIDAMKKQRQHDESVAGKLAEAFGMLDLHAFEPDNHHLFNALMEVLQAEMGDTEVCQHGQSWIEYFCQELDFGVNPKGLKATQDGKPIKLDTAGDLYDFLVSRIDAGKNGKKLFGGLDKLRDSFTDAELEGMNKGEKHEETNDR